MAGSSVHAIRDRRGEVRRVLRSPSAPQARSATREDRGSPFEATETARTQARASSTTSAGSRDTSGQAPGWLDAAVNLQHQAGNAATAALLGTAPTTPPLAKEGILAKLFAWIYKAEREQAEAKANGKLPKSWVGAFKANAILQQNFGTIKAMKLAQVEILSPAEIKSKYDGFYGAGKYDADGPLEGFERKGVNYLNAEAQSVDTVIHESLHSQEHADWDAITYKDGMSSIGEGATEILTQIAAKQAGLKPSSSYPDEAKLVKRMCQASSLDTLKKAYFLGNGDFKKEVSDLLDGTWDQFQVKVKAGDFPGAGAMIKKKAT